MLTRSTYAPDMSGREAAPGGAGDPLWGVEQYPRTAETVDPWSSKRRQSYLQALEELHAAGRLSRREIEKTMIERAQAEARHAREATAATDGYERYPRPSGEVEIGFYHYGDGPAFGSDWR